MIKSREFDALMKSDNVHIIFRVTVSGLPVKVETESISYCPEFLIWCLEKS